ncbi:hypothetical protein AB0L04_10300 [Streptomyces glaucescens]|uniref:hypothetical protein n=1 Tax=Streptomyces glaucescens TaxID=1907 RepID=UPI00344E3A5C
MVVASWDDMATQDLLDATDDPATRREFLDLAETELRYPPILNSDEGFVVQYDRGYAYRRALRRHAPSRAADLNADPAIVDGDGFPYGDYYYVYRKVSPEEFEKLSERGETAQLLVRRLLHISAMVAQLGESTIQ